MKKLKTIIAPLLMLAEFGCASVPAYAETAEPPAGNGPYFLGAGIAVLALIGVAIFCKFKGER